MPQKTAPKRPVRPAQKQHRQPGIEAAMVPKPRTEMPDRRGSGRLEGKRALITGGDSGIGRAVAALFAKEGADIAVVYLNEHEDAAETRRLVESHGRRCTLLPGDVGDGGFCKEAVERAVRELGGLDVLVNNAGEQHPETSIEKISEDQLTRTFRTNIFSYFFMTQSALPYLMSGSSIINTSSVTAYRGSADLIDYASSKGAIVAFTRSLSQALADKGVRVNAVAPGPVWTPLIASTFPPDKVKSFGTDVPLGHAGQPAEIAPSFLFLACSDGSYMTGQVLHPNGGEIVNG